MVREASDVQPWNAFAPMDVIADPVKSIDWRAGSGLKAALPMETIVFPLRERVTRPFMPVNALSGISVRNCSERSRVSRRESPKNANEPMEEILFVLRVRKSTSPRPPWKAYDSMDVIWFESRAMTPRDVRFTNAPCGSEVSKFCERYRTVMEVRPAKAPGAMDVILLFSRTRRVAEAQTALSKAPAGTDVMALFENCNETAFASGG